MILTHLHFRIIVTAVVVAGIAVSTSQVANSQTGGPRRVYLPLTRANESQPPAPTATPGPAPTATPRPSPTAQPTPPANAAWIFCANEAAGCSFSGRRIVRFGSGDTWIYAEHFNGLEDCNRGPFGGQRPNVTVARCEYASQPVYSQIGAPAADNHSTMHVNIDLSKIPAGHSGFDQRRIRTSQFPVEPSDGSGAFRTACNFSHMAFDDPIVYPNQPGRSHLHMFFGNTAITANSTYSSVISTGRSTCSGGIINRSAYWTPALVDTRTGEPLVPNASVWYYKSGYYAYPLSSIQPIPDGFRMIGGNRSMTQLDADVHHAWHCRMPNSQDHVSGPTIPTNCATGAPLELAIRFPTCRDGVNLSSTDGRSHVVYTVDGNCPSSHPTPIPEISLNMMFELRDVAMLQYLRLSSDMATSGPGGYSMHADWFDGWEPAIKRTFMTRCSAQPVNCGTENLGDGNALY